MKIAETLAGFCDLCPRPKNGSPDPSMPALMSGMAVSVGSMLKFGGEELLGGEIRSNGTGVCTGTFSGLPLWGLRNEVGSSCRSSRNF